ncbi:hypothetical protein SEA_COMRADE_253 [Streptomyces phage Comrade]|uniref:Uncharacterized protein n=2 Tax=Gilsonvirus comrade TaxID=2846395 RepID=A0A385DVR4_9CAUD|nr:hypothetical protein HWB84_gp025 [Streptomyces phage Comrade]AXQ63484.1 hypothetical protein SEA_COMRADE_253 [Streptomyces phage Comrade]QQO39910.1 membrane protein [Streptomyces phage Belfort]QZE11822.1 membrane protein [Streptomyces phage Karp]
MDWGGKQFPPLSQSTEIQLVREATMIVLVFLGMLALSLVFGAIAALPIAWLVMLIMGALHSVWPNVENLSFLSAWVATWLVAILAGLFVQNNR